MVRVSMAVVVIMVMVVMAAVFVVDMAGLAMGRIGELGIDVEDPAEVEAAEAQYLIQRDIGALGAGDRGQRVKLAQARLDRDQFGLADQVGLVEDDPVGEGDLLARLLRVVQTRHDVFGVDQGGDAVELRLRLDVLIDKEGLGHRAGVGQASGLDDDGVEGGGTGLLAFHQTGDDADQVAAHRAADAAVVHLEHVLVGTHHEVVVDADLAELIDDHCVALAVILGEDAVQQGGLAGTEVAGEDGDGDFVGHGAHLGAAEHGRQSGSSQRAQRIHNEHDRSEGRSARSARNQCRRTRAASHGRPVSLWSL